VARGLIRDRDRETFLVLCLDTKLAVNAAYVVAVGSLDHCPLRPREVFNFKAALLANPASVSLAHNHPSGDPLPRTTGA
jgi:DNA repair protein RadC